VETITRGDLETTTTMINLYKSQLASQERMIGLMITVITGIEETIETNQALVARRTSLCPVSSHIMN
jgi:hypothetical protein